MWGGADLLSILDSPVLSEPFAAAEILNGLVMESIGQDGQITVCSLVRVRSVYRTFLAKLIWMDGKAFFIIIYWRHIFNLANPFAFYMALRKIVINT